MCGESWEGVTSLVCNLSVYVGGTGIIIIIRGCTQTCLSSHALSHHPLATSLLLHTHLCPFLPRTFPPFAACLHTATTARVPSPFSAHPHPTHLFSLSSALFYLPACLCLVPLPCLLPACLALRFAFFPAPPTPALSSACTHAYHDCTFCTIYYLPAASLSHVFFLSPYHAFLSMFLLPLLYLSSSFTSCLLCTLALYAAFYLALCHCLH